MLEDAEHLIAIWNERQVKRMPMLFSPTIGASIELNRTTHNSFSIRYCALRSDAPGQVSTQHILFFCLLQNFLGEVP